MLLLGRSLLLSSVAASLEDNPGLCVTRSATWAEAESLLAGDIPEVVIFDPAFTGESGLLSFLCQHPQLVVVGLDGERDRAVRVVAEEARELTLERVSKIVEGR